MKSQQQLRKEKWQVLILYILLSLSCVLSVITYFSGELRIGGVDLSAGFAAQSFLMLIFVIIFRVQSPKDDGEVRWRGVWAARPSLNIPHPFPEARVCDANENQDDGSFVIAYPRRLIAFAGVAFLAALGIVGADVTNVLSADDMTTPGGVAFYVLLIGISLFMLSLSLPMAWAALKRIPQLYVSPSHVELCLLRSRNRIAWPDVERIQIDCGTLHGVIVVRRDEPSLDPNNLRRTLGRHMVISPTFGCNTESLSAFLCACHQAFAPPLTPQP